MALKLTVESFLQVVRQSGLIDKEKLQKLLQQYEAQGVDVTTSQSIADALVGDEIVTRWQAEKLLAGKHKGFSLGKYKLLDLLGKGGMSSVYLAEHVLMKRRCAIKVLPSKRVNEASYLARFHREAQAVASVDHPNIVRAYDVDCAQDRDSQTHFLVMEYVTGQSLQELIARNGPANFADAVEYIRQSAEGLEHAHRAGLVHRDIKPGNILIDTNGVIKILDMGLARFFNDAEANPLTVAHDEKVLGTADYLAPEQALDSHAVDTRADIYSLGCSLYFFLTGHPPFTEGTLTQRLIWHQSKPFPPLTDTRIDCPVSLSAILNKMVEKKPEDRYQSAAEVAEACRQWLADNVGADWKQSRLPLSHASARAALPPRDLYSAPAILKPNSDVVGSVESPADADDSSAGDILRPTTATAAPTQSPTAPPIAVPVVVPVAAPPLAVPIAKPVAAPLPPVAKPVVPIAAPVVATPVASPVMAALPKTTSAGPGPVPINFFAEASSETTQTPTDFQFDNQAANEAILVTPLESSAETGQDDNLFALFGAQSEETSTEEVEPEVHDAPIKSVPRNPSFVETVVIASPSPESDASELSFGASRAELVAPTLKKSANSISDLLKNPAVRYVSLALAGVVVIGGIAWWSTRGSGESGNPSANSTKNGKAEKLLGSSAAGGAKKSAAYEVTLVVGAGGEFKSIGRAVHSAVESRAEHEKAANGKPLRFLIQVKSGQIFEEAIVFDESFPGEVHLTSETAGKPATLTSPSLSEPAITIKNRSGVTIENLKIDLAGFPQKEKGIVISGSVERCRVRNCVISDPGKAGIELSGAVGGEGADGIVLELNTIQKASPTAAGVHIGKSGNGGASQRVTVQRCRFFGSMSAGVLLEGSVESLTVRNCGVTGSTSGIRFAEGVVAKNVLIDHCSFRNQAEAGLLFEAMPREGSGDLKWRNCLFSGPAKAELLIAKGYDANKFNSLMSADKPIENNWTDRKTKNAANGERDLLGNGGSRVPEIKFATTSPKAELFLVAQAGEPYKTAGITAK